MASSGVSLQKTGESGGPSGGGGPQTQGSLGQQQEKRKKESILNLTKFLEKPVRVKFAGGREASGILKGFDQLLNIVLDNTIEYLRDPDDPYKLTEDTRYVRKNFKYNPRVKTRLNFRQLGLVVCRGPAVVVICPMEGMEAIPNPFVQQE